MEMKNKQSSKNKEHNTEQKYEGVMEETGQLGVLINKKSENHSTSGLAKSKIYVGALYWIVKKALP